MASRHQKMQRLIRFYKDETGEKEVDMRNVANWAVNHGWKLPEPILAIDRLAREFAKAAREEIQHDTLTGDPYRVNHVYKVDMNGQLVMLWFNIDEAPRSPMHMSLMKRREQTFGDVRQMTLDAEHWNRINPQEEPIYIPPDFTEDLEESKHAPKEQHDAS